MTAEPPAAGDARIGLWQRLLHRSYRQNTGFQFFVVRRVLPGGVALFVVLTLLAILAMAQQRPAVFQAFSLCLGIALITLPWAFFRRAQLTAVREMPAHATAGEPMRYTIRVTNRAARRLRGAMIAETPPDSRPGLAEFALGREPGEEKRNAFDRAFAYHRWRWLLARRQLFDGGSADRWLELGAGETAEMRIDLTPLRRGVIRLDDLRVQLPDPFGAFQRNRKVPAPPATLTVLPRRHRIPPVEMPGSARFQIGGDATSNAIGQTGEFVGLRDYRPGDPLRQIHWKSWARTGRPIVKELEDTFYPRHGLVLDTFPQAEDAALFEDAVSVAASFAATLDTRESLLDLIFIKDTAHVVTAGRGLARAEKLLEVLAAVEGEPVPDFETLGRLVLRHREKMTSCLIVLAGWNQERSEFLETLRGGGVACVPIVLGHGHAPENVPGHWIESGQLSRDLRRLPARLTAI